MHRPHGVVTEEREESRIVLPIESRDASPVAPENPISRYETSIRAVKRVYATLRVRIRVRIGLTAGSGI